MAILAQSSAKVARYFNANREGAAASLRVKKMFDSLYYFSGEELRHERCDLSDHTSLSVSNLNFSYQEDSKKVINGFSYDFRKASFYCICGPSGVGKSTLLKLILGLLKADSGEIKLNKAFKEENPIGYLPQNVQIFPGSIAENIIYPSTELNENELQNAIRKVRLDSFVDSLPQKIFTRLGFGSEQELSGGQAQRLMLARLFYHNFPIVVVDEGTSALDPELEKIIYHYLIELKNKVQQ